MEGDELAMWTHSLRLYCLHTGRQTTDVDGDVVMAPASPSQSARPQTTDDEGDAVMAPTSPYGAPPYGPSRRRRISQRREYECCKLPTTQSRLRRQEANAHCPAPSRRQTARLEAQPAMLTRDSFVQLQKRDPYCGAVIKLLTTGELPEHSQRAQEMLTNREFYTLEDDGLLVHCAVSKAKQSMLLQWAVPAALRPLVLRLAHDDASAMHPSAGATHLKVFRAFLLARHGCRCARICDELRAVSTAQSVSRRATT